MPRREIGMVDYIRAVGHLRARDPRLQRQIAELLGLVEQRGPGEESPTDVPEAPGAAPHPPAPDLPVTEAAPAAPPVPASVDLPVHIEPLDTRRVELSWPTGLPPGPDPSDLPGARPTAPPLLAPRLERAIVQLLLASRRAGSDIDLNAALSAWARLDLDRPLPVLPEWSVHGGTDLLVDVSTALEPFADDIDRLLMMAENVGGEATRILYFEQCPGRGVFSEEQPRARYRPDRRRTLLVGSFGASPARMSAGREEWWSAVREIRDQTELVGLCPFEEGCAAFGSVIPMVRWAEATTTNGVGRVLGERKWSNWTS
jgi:hypothetical protein